MNSYLNLYSDCSFPDLKLIKGICALPLTPSCYNFQQSSFYVMWGKQNFTCSSLPAGNEWMDWKLGGRVELRFQDKCGLFMFHLVLGVQQYQFSNEVNETRMSELCLPIRVLSLQEKTPLNHCSNIFSTSVLIPGSSVSCLCLHSPVLPHCCSHINTPSLAPCVRFWGARVRHQHATGMGTICESHFPCHP